MAENLWRWLQRLAVVAISLFGALLASAQETPNPQPSTSSAPDLPQSANTALRDLRISALASGDKIAVDWRFVSDGKSINAAPARATPKVSITGVRAKTAEPVSFAEQRIDNIIIVLLSGRNAAELDYMRATSAAAAAALPKGKYRLLIGIDGEAFQWAADENIMDPAKITGLLTPELLQNVSSPGDRRSLTTAYAAALSALKSASPRARAALIVPEPVLPNNQDLLTRLGAAAFAQRISFFPVAPEGGVSAARAQQMIDLAGPSAGRFLPDALEGRPLGERSAMFTEFQGGASQIFSIDPKALYRLPFESPDAAISTVTYGDLRDEMTLGVVRRNLSGLQLIGAILNPAHWTSWITTPGRRIWGFASLAGWLVVLGLILRLLFPPVKVYVQIAGQEKIQKIRRLPASIGRGIDQQVKLNDDNISRAHAVIEKDGKALRLRDLKSTNGTFIGGESVEQVTLRSVQTVQLGPVKLILRTRR